MKKYQIQKLGPINQELPITHIISMTKRTLKFFFRNGRHRETGTVLVSFSKSETFTPFIFENFNLQEPCYKAYSHLSLNTIIMKKTQILGVASLVVGITFSLLLSSHRDAVAEKPIGKCYCTDQYDPVCIIGTTIKFSNACRAECAGYTPDQYGPCVL